MKHYQKLLVPVALALVVWYIGWQHCGREGLCEQAKRDVVSILPLYALIVFGCYALGRIGISLYTFRDCAQEAKMLEQVTSPALFPTTPAQNGFHTGGW
ncbi:unnamed protein product [Discosporangium mesarthrocarpum]